LAAPIQISVLDNTMLFALDSVAVASRFATAEQSFLQIEGRLNGHRA
jgi:hypothetical protein